MPRILVRHISGDACKDISREDKLRRELAVNMEDIVTSAEDMGWNKTQLSPRSPLSLLPDPSISPVLPRPPPRATLPLPFPFTPK